MGIGGKEAREKEGEEAALAFVVFAEDGAEPVGNFAHRGVSLGTGKDVRHQVVAGTGGVFERAQANLSGAGVA